MPPFQGSSVRRGTGDPAGYIPTSMYQKILVGTDGSKTAAKAVDRAVEVARAAGASLTIFSAANPAKGEQVVTAEAQRHAAAGVTIDTKVVDDEPVSALVEVARVGGYDLIVMGNR